MNPKTLTIDGLEMDLTGAAGWKSRGCRWTCVVCRQGFSSKKMPVYHRGSGTGLCDVCHRDLPGARADAPSAQAPNLSRANSQSGGSYTDILEDCGPDREFAGDVYGGDL